MDKNDLIKNIEEALVSFSRSFQSLGPPDWINPEFTKKVFSSPEYRNFEDLKLKMVHQTFKWVMS
jgi:hypothetical protein